MKDESSVPAAQKMTDASLLIFRVEVQKRRVQMIDDIVAVLKKAEAGVAVAELIRQVKMSRSTFYRWRKRYVRQDAGEGRNLMQLHRDNTLPKKWVSYPSPGKASVQAG